MSEKNTYSATKQILFDAVTPSQTRTYKPVLHRQLIDLTLESIEKAGFKIDKELYSASNDGQVANGRFTIKDVADDEMQLQIGWQNSYNRKLSLKFAIGTRIFICENGSVSGDFGAFRKRHKGDIQEFTPAHIVDYIQQAGDAFRKMQEERDMMKQVGITKRQQAELVGRMFIEEEFISSTQLNIIQEELKHPSHDYRSPKSLWELYNYTTYALKEIHPSLWMSNHIKAHRFFTSQL